MYTKRFPSTLTVQELIDTLMDIPEDQRDTPVLFSCDYGDYHHTLQTLGISDISSAPRTVQPEAYSHSGWGLPRTDGEEEGEDVAEDARVAFILS